MCQVSGLTLIESGKGSLKTPSSGLVLNFGLCVWSTGNAPLDFTTGLGLPLSR